MFKIFGSALIVVSTSMLGINKIKSFKERLRYLEDIQRTTVILENEMRYTQTPFLGIFFKLYNSSNSALREIFLSTYNLMKEEKGYTFKEMWIASVRNKETDFFAEDIELLESFSDCFGNSDVEGELKTIKLYSEKISYVLNRSKDEYEKNRKLYKNLGIYAGLLISVLLI